MMQGYTLSADTLFGFGKSTLKPSGEAKLDDLADKLRQVNIESITDTGHADRIGSSEMNQKLSLRGAESVKAYLVSKGVESDRIAGRARARASRLPAPMIARVRRRRKSSLAWHPIAVWMSRSWVHAKWWA